MTLEEDQPEMVARMLVYIYGQKYPVTLEGKTHVAESTRKLLPAHFTGIKEDIKREGQLSVHAAVYGIADKYDCQSLKAACEQAYVGQLSAQTSLRDFIASINIIYENTPKEDKGLRKWAVWFSQGYKEVILVHPGFKSFFCSQPDFAWDFATNYLNTGRYWCDKCKTYQQVSQTECSCGTTGICIGGQACKSYAPECMKPKCSGAIQHWNVFVPDDDPRKYFTTNEIDQKLKSYNQKHRTN